ncbi:MAG: ABC transporter ATP-binding protein [Lachnospiraceae bacterium]|nr:ABC transporter ATP-binding protein [Lachnospiraceae bacterium]
MSFIECDGLVKIFKTEEIEVMALQGLDMTVEKGELIAVIGKSGSGKSTLMNIVGGLEKPSAGRVLVDGVNLSELSEKEMDAYRKKRVGFVWQKAGRNLFGFLTSRDNIISAMQFTKLKKAEKEKRADMLLELVDMTKKADSLPANMSGGEQQRIGIAVALANDPDILLADEPTGAVDSMTSDMIFDMFRKLNKELGITIIIVTHDNSLAAKVDRVLSISDGKVSTESIIKEQVRKRLEELSGEEYSLAEGLFDNSHEEYSVLDKARRLQLSKEMLGAAGISGNRVKVSYKDGNIVISGEKSST